MFAFNKIVQFRWLGGKKHEHNGERESERERELSVVYVDQKMGALHTVCRFFNTHLCYSFNFTVVYLCHVMGGIPPPSGGIVGKTGVPGVKPLLGVKGWVP